MTDPQDTPHPDAAVALAALARAGHRARLLAAQTRTRLIVYRDGRTVAEEVPLSVLEEEPGPVPVPRP